MRKLFLAFFMLSVLSLNAQQVSDSNTTTENKETTDTTRVGGLSIEKLNEYKQQAEQLVFFLQYTFNVLGDPTASVSDKQTIINESYIKFFKDEKVQIEDDLVNDRKTITSKDVQAYLKDIEFFFKKAEFTFEIEEITHNLNDRNKLYLRVSINRNLKAVTLKKDTINENQQRYIEINLDEEQEQLKIVSIYTTKLNEEEEMRNWWAALPAYWKEILSATINVSQTPTLEQIKQINDIEKLDISGRKEIQKLDAISKFSKLKILKANGTSISDLMPIRNLNKLEILDLSDTRVKSLEPLKYATELKDLYLNNTEINSLLPLTNFRKLEKLQLEGLSVCDCAALNQLTLLTDVRLSDSQINDLSAFKELKNIQTLYLNNTQIADLKGIEGLTKLTRLYIKNTAIADLAPLKSLENLEYLYADNTRVASLNALTGLKKLEKVYVDGALVEKTEADKFIQQLPNCKVIYQSSELLKWWVNISPFWKKKLSEYKKINENASKEELHELLTIEEIDVSNEKTLTSIAPLEMLSGLKKLTISKTAVEDISPLAKLFDLTELYAAETKITDLKALSELKNLEKLDISQTTVSTLSPLAELEKITWIGIDKTPIADLSPLLKSTKIQTIYADESQLTDTSVRKFKESNSSVLIIYQTKRLKAWWFSISTNWKQIFETRMKWTAEPTREQLHQLLDIEELIIEKNAYINSLSPIQDFTNLKKLRIADTQINNLIPITNLTSLEVLEFPQNPINNLMPLQNLKKLQVLDAQNTLVEDLTYIKDLTNLKILRLSGSQVKKLNGLENTKLEELEIFSTDIRNLKPIHSVKTLRVLKCYSTKLSQRKIDAFKEENRRCNVVFY